MIPGRKKEQGRKEPAGHKEPVWEQMEFQSVRVCNAPGGGETTLETRIMVELKKLGTPPSDSKENSKIKGRNQARISLTIKRNGGVCVQRRSDSSTPGSGIAHLGRTKEAQGEMI